MNTDPMSTDSITPEVLTGSQVPSTTETSRGKHLWRASGNAVARLTGNALEVLAELSRPTRLHPGVDPGEVTVTFRDITTEYTRLQEETEICQELWRAITRTWQHLQEQGAELHRIQRSLLRSALNRRFDQHLRDITTRLDPLLRVIRITRSLESIWRRRPVFLRPREQRIVTLSSRDLGGTPELLTTMPSGAEYHFRDCRAQGSAFYGIHLDRSVHHHCQFDDPDLTLRSSPHQQQERRHQWRQLGEDLARIPCPDLTAADFPSALSPLLRLQETGWNLVFGPDQPRAVPALNGSTFTHCIFRGGRLVSESGSPLVHLTFSGGTMTGLEFHGDFRCLRWTNLSQQAVLLQGTLVDSTLTDSTAERCRWDDLRLRNTDILRWHHRGGLLRNVSILGGRVQHWVLEDVLLSGVLELRSAVTALTLRRVLVEPRTQFTGHWTHLRFEDVSPRMLAHISVGEATFEQVEFVRCGDRPRFADRDGPRSSSRTGEAPSMSPDDPFTRSREEQLRQVSWHGQIVYSADRDSSPRLKEARDNARAVLRHAEDLRSGLNLYADDPAAHAESIALVLLEAGYLPITHQGILRLMQELSTPGPEMWEALSDLVTPALRQGRSIEELAERVSTDWAAQGYRVPPDQVRPEIARLRADLMEKNGQELQEHPVMQRFTTQYPHEWPQYLADVLPFLREHLPFLLPVDQARLRECYLRFHPTEERRRDHLSGELQQLTTDISLFLEQLQELEGNEHLSTEKKEDLRDLWEGMMERHIERWERNSGSEKAS